MDRAINLRVNGESVQISIRPNRRLLDVLRDDLGLTGTKEACGMGECGACTVLLNGRAVNACLYLAVRADGAEVVTIEGLARNGVGAVREPSLHPIQQAFLEKGAFQCGFCTPGQVMRAKALLDENPAPTEAEVRYALAGNICRCTGYVKIVEAVLAAAERLRETV